MEVNLISKIKPHYSPTEQIFTNRGVPIEKVNELLNTTDDHINSYWDLENIVEAVDMLHSHIEKGNHILIEVDCDVDGYTSAALLYNYVKSNYPQANLSYNVHDYKRHGLDMTDDVKNNKYDLIVVIDAGSNEYEKHKKLNELNIDCLVIDHHEADKESEYALVVNNQLSPDYENKELSGVGVVWQVCRAFDELKHNSGKIADDFLDLVALGLD